MYELCYMYPELLLLNIIKQLNTKLQFLGGALKKVTLCRLRGKMFHL